MERLPALLVGLRGSKDLRCHMPHERARLKETAGRDEGVGLKGLP